MLLNLLLNESKFNANNIEISITLWAEVGSFPFLIKLSSLFLFSAIRAFHAFLAREFQSPNPTDSLPEVKQSKRLPKALTVDEVQSIIEVAQNPTNPLALRDSLILELLYGTGGRVSEIVGIALTDISTTNLEGNEVTTIKLKGKGGKERIVPIGSFAKKALDDYLIRTRPLLSKNPKVTYILLNARGTKLSRQSAWSAVKDAAARANIATKVTPHVFRHSYATHLLDGGADIRAVQELLGHASVTTTQIYTAVTLEKLRENYAAAHPRAR